MLCCKRVQKTTKQTKNKTTKNTQNNKNNKKNTTNKNQKNTPNDNSGGLVTLEVLQEVSDAAPPADQTSTLGTPTFSERRVKSTIAIHDNETVALGGLISHTRTKGSSCVPYLSAIPVVGALFGKKTDNTVRTELMVLITPHVVENLEAARAITEELRQKFPTIAPLLSGRR